MHRVENLFLTRFYLAARSEWPESDLSSNLNSENVELNYPSSLSTMHNSNFPVKRV